MPDPIRVRFLKDTRHGKQGTFAWLAKEYVEALMEDGKAEILSDKSMTNRAGIATRMIPKGGLQSRRDHGIA